METSCPNFKVKEKKTARRLLVNVISVFYSFFSDAFLSGNSVNTAAKDIITEYFS